MSIKSLLFTFGISDESCFEDIEHETKHGIDKLSIMLKIIGIIEAPNKKKIECNMNRFYSFLVQKLKRGISNKEKLGLLEGINNYIKSEPGSNERLESMDYLFSLKFIES